MMIPYRTGQRLHSSPCADHGITTSRDICRRQHHHRRFPKRRQDTWSGIHALQKVCGRHA